MNSLIEAKKVMDKKHISVLVFPEGTRSKTGEVQSFKRGAFYLAAHSGYPIVPITINGTKKIMPKGTFKLKSGTIYLHFDKPIPTDNIKTKQDELALMEKVREVIISNQKEYELMPVTKKDVEKIAELAQLKFSEQELESFTPQMNEILAYMDKLNELDTENVEPLSHPVEQTNVFREDELKPSITTEDALKNAPAKDEHYFKVPKVIGDK